MNTLQEQKSMLAQLLATENITIVHDKQLDTAAFDPINRKLFLPVLKEMSGPVYDLFVLHEVSHALHTPKEGFHNEKHPQGQRFKGFLNVVEDARIEKLIKRRYPGGKASMIKGYHDLMSQDFFGVKNMDPNELPFVDRFNLYFKIGMSLNIKFKNETEENFVERGMKLESWDDAEKLTLDIWKYSKDEELTTDIQNMMQDMAESQEDGEGEDTDLQMSGENEVDSREDGEETTDKGAQQSSGKGDEETDEDSQGEGEGFDMEVDGLKTPETLEPEDFDEEQMGSEGGGYGGVQDMFKEHFDQEPVSITDTNFREREKELSDGLFEGNVYDAVVPTRDFRDYIVSYKDMLGYFVDTHKSPEQYASQGYRWGVYDANRWSFGDYPNTTRFTNFQNKNKPIVRHMVKEFEARKSAQMHERSKTHMSGIIDSSKLYKYKFDDRIFKTITTVPEGKNHGLVFFIDCSGSMSHVFGTVMEQTCLLAMFCQMVKIPYRIYGFTNMGLTRDYDSPISKKYERTYREMREEYETDAIRVDPTMRLYEFFSDTMTKSDFKEMGEWLIGMTDTGHCPVPLSGTPLNDAVIVSIDLVNEFKRQYNVDICNTIFLTDGDSSSGGDINHVYERFDQHTGQFVEHKTWTTPMPDDIVTYRHRKTGTVFQTKPKSRRSGGYWNRRYNTTHTMLDLFRECTGQEAIGINIFPKFTNYMANDVNTPIHEAREKFRKNGFLATTKEGARGYSKLFSVPNKMLTMTDSASEKFDEMERGVKTSSIGRAFSSMAKQRKSQRMFLTEFVDMVS